VISKGLAAPYSFMLSLLVGMKIQIGVGNGVCSYVTRT